ncbi:ribosome subunit biogenesis protein NIP7 [Pycnococcus provasolii]
MRPLTDEESRMVFEKMYKFVGKSIKTIVDDPANPHLLRVHRQKVYYIREEICKRAGNVARDHLVALGTNIGKFTHAGKFRLTIGALDLLAKHAKNKIWVKPTSEMSYMYGNNVLKSGLGRITEATPAYTGVVIYTMADVPIGFGVTARSTQECRKLEPSAVVAFNQADVGLYLRSEDTM